MRDECGGGDYPEGDKTKTEPGTSKVESQKTLSDLALGLVSNARSAEYGPPLINHWRIGQVWSAVLDVEDVPPWKVALMMAGLKIARLAETPSDDSLIDAVGYLEIVRQLRP